MHSPSMPESLIVRRRQGRSWIECRLTPQTIRALLLERDCALTPAHELQSPEGPWHPLSDIPELIPWHEMLEKAITSLAAGDAANALLYARRLRAFDPGEHQEATASANFILGHLEQLRGSPHARMFYQHALSGPALVRAAAYSNMGVVNVLRNRDVVGAEHDFAQAIASEPSFLPAHLNRLRLRDQLTREKAPSLPGERPWSELADESRMRLAELQFEQGPRFLNSTFPSSACIHLLPSWFGPPPLGLCLPPSDTGLDAAREMLESAAQANREGRYPTAILLAEAAKDESSSLAASASPVRRAAADQDERQRRVARARRRTRLLEHFDRALATHDWERVEQILTDLAEISPQTTCDQLCARRDHALAEHYRERAAESADQSAAAHYYLLAAHWSDRQARETCERQSVLARLHGWRRRFRRACEEGNRIRAGKLMLRLGATGNYLWLLQGVKKLWETLVRFQGGRENSGRGSESLFAQAEEQLRQGRLKDAKQLLDELRVQVPADPIVTDLERRLIAAEHLASARDHARHRKDKDMIGSLESCLELDPGNTEALAHLADAELLQRFGRSPRYFAFKLVVEDALEKLQSARYADLGNSLKAIEELSNTRFYVVLAKALPPGRNGGDMTAPLC